MENQPLCTISATYSRAAPMRAERGAGVRLLERSAGMRHEIGVFDLEAESLFTLAVAERASNNLGAVLEHAQQAIRITEFAREEEAPGEWFRPVYVAKHSEMYEFAVNLYMEMYRSNPHGGDDRHAFQMHERGLARALIDRLSLSREDLVKGVDNALLQKSKQFEDLISLRSNELLQIYERTHKPVEEKTARARLDSALAEYRLAEAQIRASSRAYRTLAESGGAVYRREMQRTLVGSVLCSWSLRLANHEATSGRWTTPASGPTSCWGDHAYRTSRFGFSE